MLVLMRDSCHKLHRRMSIQMSEEKTRAGGTRTRTVIISFANVYGVCMDEIKHNHKSEPWISGREEQLLGPRCEQGSGFGGHAQIDVRRVAGPRTTISYIIYGSCVGNQ